MNRMKLLVVFLLITVLHSAAFAELVDFTDAAWSGADGQQSWTVPYAWGDVTVQIDTSYGHHLDEVLYWDPIDGFGVTSPEDFTDPEGLREPDEIDDGESFQINFSGDTYVYGIYLTDLYAEFPPEPRSPEWTDWGGSGDGSGEAEGEGGMVENEVTWVRFWGQDSDQFNGEQYVPFNMFATTLDFYNVCSNSDYSVAGVEAVPVPGAVILGSLGIGFVSWKLRRRKEL